MERSIIDKLLQWDGVDSFRAAVTQAQYHLRCGLLLNPREVEVKLVVDGRVSTSKSECLRRNLLTVISPATSRNRSTMNIEGWFAFSVMKPCQIRVGSIATMLQIWIKCCLYSTNYKKGHLCQILSLKSSLLIVNWLWMNSNANQRYL